MTGVRFAPSPTGRFHLGNLRTAWISWRWAQALATPWVLRFEDIDTPRRMPGARESQLADLATLGLVPDQVIIQSMAIQRHWKVVERGLSERSVYPCTCSRKEVQDAIARAASAPHSDVSAYSGHCRELDPKRKFDVSRSLAWRFRMPNTTGHDDFIVARSEHGSALSLATFTPSYHLACAVDDFDGNYQLLVRACDLESAKIPQQALMNWMAAGEPAKLPAIYHTALVIQDDGHRLEKRTAGVTLQELEAAGIPPAEVVRRFAASLKSEEPTLQTRHEFLSGESLNEAKSTLTLSELGLHV